jgi:hypothetical protein
MKTKLVHLFRGSPVTRSWSQYHETVREWTLCGIKLRKRAVPTEVNEDPELTTCEFCRRMADLKPVKMHDETHETRVDEVDPVLTTGAGA